MSELVHVYVDPHVCVGVGVCEQEHPDVFIYDENEGLATARPGVTISREDAQSVVEACPSGAISIVEDGDDR